MFYLETVFYHIGDSMVFFFGIVKRVSRWQQLCPVKTIELCLVRHTFNIAIPVFHS